MPKSCALRLHRPCCAELIRRKNARALAQLDALAVNDGDTRAADQVEPLGRAPVPIVVGALPACS